MWVHRVIAEMIEAAIEDSNLESVIIVGFFAVLAIVVLAGLFL